MGWTRPLRPPSIWLPGSVLWTIRVFLELPAGIPSHDTFRAVLSALDAKQLARTLIDWTERVRTKPGGEIVAIDGKSARRSGSSARAVRGHWGVENSLHWRLDVRFKEDQSAGAHPLCCRQPCRAP